MWCAPLIRARAIQGAGGVALCVTIGSVPVKSAKPLVPATA